MRERERERKAIIDKVNLKIQSRLLEEIKLKKKYK